MPCRPGSGRRQNLTRIQDVVGIDCSFYRTHQIDGHFAVFQRHVALLAYADAMTRDIDVSDAVFARLRSHYSERQTVELTMLIGAYNMHSRVLKALCIELESAHGRGWLCDDSRTARRCKREGR